MLPLRRYLFVIPLVAALLCQGCASTGGRSGRAGYAFRFASADKVMRTAVADAVFPGGVAIVGRKGRIEFARAFGHFGTGDERPVTVHTIYDLASLTKVIATTTAVMLLVRDEKIDLNARVSEYVPEWHAGYKSTITVHHLLTHTSGLPAFRRVYSETTTRQAALDSILATPVNHEPGTHYEYSDLGAIMLGIIVERVSGQTLADFLRKRVYEPLCMTSTAYRPPFEWFDRIAPTENDPWRRRAVRGEVHDENAARLGGISGHAGLFSTGPDLARFAVWMLDAYHARLDPTDSLYLGKELVQEFTRRQPGPEGSTRALGWDTPSSERSTAGNMMSRESFGHTGFTGTSIWIDPEEELFVILLTNRVHPTRANSRIQNVRGPLADSLYSTIMTEGL